MTKTANDVVTLALKRLQIIGAGESADGDDYADAYNEYLVFHEWGRDTWPRSWSWNAEAVDDRYWTNVAGVLAGRLLGVFPVSQETRANAEREAAKAETYLRQQFTKKPRTTVQMQVV